MIGLETDVMRRGLTGYPASRGSATWLEFDTVEFEAEGHLFQVDVFGLFYRNDPEDGVVDCEIGDCEIFVHCKAQDKEFRIPAGPLQKYAVSYVPYKKLEELAERLEFEKI